MFFSCFPCYSTRPELQHFYSYHFTINANRRGTPLFRCSTDRSLEFGMVNPSLRVLLGLTRLEVPGGVCSQRLGTARAGSPGVTARRLLEAVAPQFIVVRTIMALALGGWGECRWVRTISDMDAAVRGVGLGGSTGLGCRVMILVRHGFQVACEKGVPTFCNGSPTTNPPKHAPLCPLFLRILRLPLGGFDIAWKLYELGTVCRGGGLGVKNPLEVQRARIVCKRTLRNRQDANETTLEYSCSLGVVMGAPHFALLCAITAAPCLLFTFHGSTDCGFFAIQAGYPLCLPAVSIWR